MSRVQSDYANTLENLPLAKLERFKANLSTPTDVSEAGLLLGTVRTMKSSLEVRHAKRQANLSHSFDGSKWKRKICSTQSTTSSRHSKTPRRSHSSAEVHTPTEGATSTPTEPASTSSPPDPAPPTESSDGILVSASAEDTVFSCLAECSCGSSSEEAFFRLFGRI